jgi:hypothetical protein
MTLGSVLVWASKKSDKLKNAEIKIKYFMLVVLHRAKLNKNNFYSKIEEMFLDKQRI